jgi:hypothetical protein
MCWLLRADLIEALNTDLVCDAINVAMRELFLQIVYGRSKTAFSEGGLPIDAGLEDLGKRLRRQARCMAPKQRTLVTLAIGIGLQSFCIPGSFGMTARSVSATATSALCFYATSPSASSFSRNTRVLPPLKALVETLPESAVLCSEVFDEKSSVYGSG